MTEQEAVYARHSVRDYCNQKIEAEKVEEIRRLLEECNMEGILHLQFVEDAEGAFTRLLNRMMGLSSAPSVIACVGADDPTLDERIGYYGEKVVLRAQQLGLNTCWAGTFKASGVKAEVAPGERLAIVIAIGYGAHQGKQRRSKKPEQVFRGGMENPSESVRRAVEYALLAPTAINQQRFELVQEQDRIEVRDLGGVLSKIDKGIVQYHVDLALKV